MGIKIINHQEAKSPQPTTVKLKVEKIDPKDYPAAAKAIKAWAEIADQKQKHLESAERILFTDSMGICSAVSSILEAAKDRPSGCFDEAYLCKDEDGNEHGVMLVTRQHYSKDLYVCYLATHPRNIRSKTNKDEPHRVAGAGTTLLQKAHELAAALKLPAVRLHALSSAKPFYIKQGFTEVAYNTMIKTVQVAAEKLAA